MHDGAQVLRHDGLAPATSYAFDGVEVRTLPRPPGERLATVATVNDVHFGETVAGMVEGLDVGEVFASAPGEEPYPEVMNRGAVGEIAALDPDVVVAKGDLTAAARPQEYQRFLEVYGGAFGDRLRHIRGNHDAPSDLPIPVEPQSVELPGVTLALLDTVVPGEPGGQVTGVQLEWLDDLAAGSDGPVLVMGHHHAWCPESATRPTGYFGIDPSDSERLVEVVARRPSIVAVLAGHTHRNRVRRFSATADVPWIEVACVKDYPGSWAEYRVFEGGILQVHHRISAPDALAWSERTRGMFGGLYPLYAFGGPDDRNLAIELRRATTT